ncbi:MAG: hypothetical protein ACODAQ_10470, partial [Phycisphaeraceae bacterium]
LLNVPYWEQTAFSEEMINRAGGLSHAYPSGTPDRKNRQTERDVVLLSVRSWEEDEQTFREKIAEYHDKGWRITLIASRAGRPDDFDQWPIEHFIDNGAPSGAAAHGRINVLINCAIGWMWCSEYVAAMTREGKIPGILVSIMYDDAKAHNRKIQTPEGRHWIGDCEHPIPAGQLARTYHDRVRKLVTDLKSRHIQQQLDSAAQVVVERINAGKTVGLAGMGHLIMHEPMEDDVQSPVVTFMGVRTRNFKRKLDPGDLLVWLAYMGMNSSYVDYAGKIEDAGLDLVTSYAPAPPDYETQQDNLADIHTEPRNRLAHIDQPWLIGDAEVNLPCDPGSMAPVSGICRTLIFRMLDDAIAAGLDEDE